MFTIPCGVSCSNDLANLTEAMYRIQKLPGLASYVSHRIGRNDNEDR